MPNSCKSILDKMVYKGAMTPRERDKILRNIKTDIVRCGECKWGDWYTALDGNRYCYCLEADRGGRTAEDYCSYGERRTDD